MMLSIFPKCKPPTAANVLSKYKNEQSIGTTDLSGEGQKFKKSKPREQEKVGQIVEPSIRAYNLVDIATTSSHDQIVIKSIVPIPSVIVNALDHKITLAGIFAELYLHRNLGDVFIMCGESHVVLRAHRFVLSCGSAYFRDVLKIAQYEHPVIALEDVSVDVFCQILEYIYLGQVKLKHESELKEFLISARYLLVNGIGIDQCSLIL